MITAFQLLFIIFVLFALFGVVQKYKSGAIGPKGSIFWFLFWILVGVAVVWPDSTARLAEIFSIGRGVDLVIYVAIATLFYLIFRLHIKIESIGKDVTKMVRHQALRDLDHK